MRYEIKRRLFGNIVIISVILNLIMLSVKHGNTIFKSFSDIAFLFASLCWLVPMILVLVKGRKQRECTEKEMVISVYARSRKGIKWFVRFFTILFIVFILMMDFPDSRDESLPIELLDMTRSLFMLLVIEYGMILNWEQGIYKKGILFIDEWLNWEQIEAFNCHQQTQLNNGFYVVQLKVRSKRKISMLPKVRNLMVNENEKDQLIALIEEKGIERRGYF